MARSTQQDQINEINANLAALTLAVTALTALVNPAAPAKPVKAAQPKAVRTPVATTGFVFSNTFVGSGSRKLDHGSRKAFIAAHAWAKPGMSTLTLRAAVADGAKVNKGWTVKV